MNKKIPTSIKNELSRRGVEDAVLDYNGTGHPCVRFSFLGGRFQWSWPKGRADIRAMKNNASDFRRLLNQAESRYASA